MGILRQSQPASHFDRLDDADGYRTGWMVAVLGAQPERLRPFPTKADFLKRIDLSQLGREALDRVAVTRDRKDAAPSFSSGFHRGGEATDARYDFSSCQLALHLD